MTIDHSQTYWADKGRFQRQCDQLTRMIPDEGPVADGNPALERLRQAINIYYDLFNNGLCNMADEFRDVFGFQPTLDADGNVENEADLDSYHVDELRRWYDKVEKKMDIFVQRAAEEQGLIVPETLDD